MNRFALPSAPQTRATPARPRSSNPSTSKPCQPIPLESVLLRTNPRTFALQVPDDAMRSVGLLPNDVVVLENAIEPRPGDVVAALIDGQSVLRVYSVTLGRPMLRTADGHGEPLRAEELVIQGVMVHLLRSRSGRL